MVKAIRQQKKQMLRHAQKEAEEGVAWGMHCSPSFDLDFLL